VIDSVDTLASNIGTHTRTLTLISSILSLLRARTQPSRLVLHIDDSLAPGLAPQLVQTRLSPSLAHLSVHPIALLKHVATTYLTPPPPLTPLERYWRIFAPIAARPAESERLVFGPEGTGCPSAREMIVDILMRGGGDASGANGRTRGAERVFEAWTEAGACELSDLGALKDVYSRKMTTHEVGQSS
jgi:elongator complex protein 5